MSSQLNSMDSRRARPRSNFPLFRHATGRWAKKVRGKFIYFGKVANDPEGEAALNCGWIRRTTCWLAVSRGCQITPA
jgi:hypothetical protein